MTARSGPDELISTDHITTVITRTFSQGSSRGYVAEFLYGGYWYLTALGIEAGQENWYIHSTAHSPIATLPYVGTGPDSANGGASTGLHSGG